VPRLATGSLWRSRGIELLGWVNAGSRTSVLSGYLQVVMGLSLDHVGDAEAVATRVLAWLDGTTRPWMVVLDGLRAADDLAALWSTGC
jgi:hypothetical protein